MSSSDGDDDKKPPARRTDNNKKPPPRTSIRNPYNQSIPVSDHMRRAGEEHPVARKPFARMSTSGKAPRSQYPRGYTQYAPEEDDEPNPSVASRKAPEYTESSERLRFTPFYPSSASAVLPTQDSPGTEVVKKRRSTLKSIRPGSKLLDEDSVYYHVPVIEAAENRNEPQGTPPKVAPAGLMDNNPPTPKEFLSQLIDNNIDGSTEGRAKNSNDDEDDEFPLEDFVRLASSTLTLCERCYTIIDKLKEDGVVLIHVVQHYYYACNKPYLNTGREIAWKFDDHLLKQPIYWLAQSGYPFPRPGDEFAMMGMYFHPDKFIEMLQMLHFAISMEYFWFRKVATGFNWNHDEYARRLTFFKDRHPFSGWMTRPRGTADVEEINDPIQDPDDDDDDNDDGTDNHGPDRDGGGIQSKRQQHRGHVTGGNQGRRNESRATGQDQVRHSVRSGGDRQLQPNKAYIPLTIKTGTSSIEFGMGGTEASLSSTPKITGRASLKRPPDTDNSGKSYDTALVITDSGDVDVPPQIVEAPTQIPKKGATYETALEIALSSSSDSGDRKPAAKKTSSATQSTDDSTDDSDETSENNTDGSSPETLSSMSSRDSPPTRAAKKKSTTKSVRRRLQLTKEKESKDEDSDSSSNDSDAAKEQQQHCGQDSEVDDEDDSEGGQSSTTSLTY
ncbi:hypothetical protein SEMRO_915_G219770.1 [Seminavis robusta]|uniref:Uncharacterized protein n=1 Tax=Seminavis robusta TaxID=568900 RepID=A0A9N8ED50_9STRA|nr:hypothetical protein SEMRO_915_G219770.1 [Seminavis robusta]|eukprot:Sro915_g219770.1 n/a (671) ;mRNA; r:36538-38550